MKQRIHIYNLRPADKARWLPGDQYPRKVVRALLSPFRGLGPVGLSNWTRNLCLGLERIGQSYHLHSDPVPPPDDFPIGIVHGPLELARALACTHRCVTGVGVLSFPQEWTTMLADSRAIFHLQSCDWSADYFRPFFGDRIRLYAVGIDTDALQPRREVQKEYDFLVYNKLRWPDELPEPNLRQAVLDALSARGLRFREIAYGRYPGGRESTYHELLSRCRAMVFLCENETQGIAYNEALSMDVPILAWNPGRWLDPARHVHGLHDVPATSIPYWDERCGEQFHSVAGLEPVLGRFVARLDAGAYRPRDYVLEHLRLEKCARDYVRILCEAAELL